MDGLLWRITVGVGGGGGMITDSGWRGWYRPLLPPIPKKMMWLFCEIGTLAGLGILERHYGAKSSYSSPFSNIEAELTGLARKNIPPSPDLIAADPIVRPSDC